MTGGTRLGTRVKVREESVNEAKRIMVFALITNETMDAVPVLELYRNKDIVEKAFGNLKESLDLRRTFVSSEQSLDGKLFIQFVALIYLSYIKKQMQVKDFVKNYTMPNLLDKLDVIECFEQPGKSLQVGEIHEKQEQLYYDLGVTPPVVMNGWEYRVIWRARISGVYLYTLSSCELAKTQKKDSVTQLCH